MRSTAPRNPRHRCVQDISRHMQIEGRLHQLSQELIRARDEERRQVARELHDSVGQSLAAIKMSLGKLRYSLPKKNAASHSILKGCVGLADEAVKEVRTISYLMHPPLLDEAGLSPALRWYARGFSERSSIHVAIDAPDDFGRCRPEVETTIFRIVQEALTNVHRHSRSKTAQIQLLRTTGEIRLEVRDQGCGLAPNIRGNGAAQPSGVGIAGMRERVGQLNGTFEIVSLPSWGTRVRVVLPIPSSALSLADQAANDPQDNRLIEFER